MKQYSDSLKLYLHRILAINASEYLKIGLEIFHKSHNEIETNIQPALGNLSIAIELMLKAFIARGNPVLIFRGLPDKVKILFTAPDQIQKGFNWRNFDIDIRSFSYDTIELNECVGLFYSFFPNQRQTLQPFFKLLSQCRNQCVHSVIPSFQRYDLERTAYLALTILDVLKGTDGFGIWGYDSTEKDREFLKDFQHERSERVRKKIEEARKRSKTLSTQRISVTATGWDSLVVDCLICGSNGILIGDTKVASEKGGDEIAISYLEFLAESFKCEGCCLLLEDSEELKLGGMKLIYERSKSDLKDWMGVPDEYV